MAKIIVVEDDKDLNSTVCSYLKGHGFEVFSCLEVNEAYDVLVENNIDLVISDIMMPNINGFEFAEDIRETNKEIPILFMSALSDFDSKSKGFKAGIDDYMVKPINLEELILRVTALLRRSQIYISKKLNIGDLFLNEEEQSVYYKDNSIDMTVREFNILYKLLSYPNKTFTRSKLMDEFWEADTNTSSRSVDVYITKIRDKFSDCDEFEIKTVHGMGYKAVLKNEG